MADATATLGIQVTTQGVNQASNELDKLDQSAKKVAQSTKDLGAAQQQSVSAVKNVAAAQSELAAKTTATSRVMDFFRGVFGGANQELSRARAVHSLYAAAAGQTTEAVTRATNATHGFRAAIATLNPVLAASGAGLGGLAGLAGAARGGIVGLTVAIGGGLLASLERVSEGTEALRKRFTAVGGDNRQFEQLKQTARETGAELSSLTAVTQTLNSALERGQTGKWVGDLSQISANSTLAAKSLADLSKAASADFAAVSDALKGILATGKLTQQVFIDIVRANEAVGLAIARAFNQPTIAAMSERLRIMPADARELASALERIGPAAQDAASKTTTLKSGLGTIKQGILDIADALENTFIGRAATAFGNFLSWIARAIRATSQLRASVNSMTLGGRGQPPTSGPSFQQNQSGSTLFDSGTSTGFGPPPGSVTAPSSGGFVNPPNSVSGEFFGPEFVGAFASGGSFDVPGSGATDSKFISMSVTPGERVTVTPPQQNAASLRPIIQQFVFPNVTQPQPFIAAAAQVKRASRRALM